MTNPIPNCPQGETEFKDRAYTPEQEAARYATDLRHLIYLDTQFDMRGETDLKLPQMQALEARGWIAEGEENGEYTITEEGERIITATLRQQAEQASDRMRSYREGYEQGKFDAAAEQAEQAGRDHEFKNFHRLLCERFGYAHDEKDWKRDQLSLIEWIAKKQGEQAGGVVSDEVVDRARTAFGRAMYPLPGETLNKEQFRCMRAALEAVAPLLRAPAEQGGMVDEDVMRSLREVADKPDNAGWVSSIRPSDARAILAALAQNAQPQHPDDAAVDRFAAALKSKLADARAKGRGGWNDDEPGMQQRLSDMLRAHVEKGDPRDVGNFARFLHQRGESILPAQNARVEAVAAGYITAKDVEFLRAAKRPSEARIASEPFGNMTVPVYLHAERARVPESVLRLPEKWRSQGENIGPSVGHLARAVCAHELDALLAAAPSQPEDAA